MLRKARQGFTLVELMIVLAIVAVLAAIAIPTFGEFHLRSKRIEGKVHIKALRTTEMSYRSAHDVFVVCGAQPAGVPGTSKRPWPSPAAGFDVIGWRPEGQVYFQYEIAAADPMKQFTVVAQSNIDGVGAQACWGYSYGAIEAVAGCTPTLLEEIQLVTPENVF